MAACVFIGDEVSALGFRLAGAEVHQPDPRELRGLFTRLLTETSLIILTAELASALPADLLRGAELATWPLVVVIPDARARGTPPDLVAEMRHQLGMSE
ncbi:MAG: Vacuolar H+transporting two-sector ATPase F subunit [Sphingobacteriia bacterium]|nr:Vacuolar H+transporting two-sector ATPase F subunit [Sphingobacteriia bacterium]NCC37916.1 Vacuolar H+transporting two-sector ATPase F subunit [Gammaproteobacteria bacterium]